MEVPQHNSMWDSSKTNFSPCEKSRLERIPWHRAVVIDLEEEITDIKGHHFKKAVDKAAVLEIRLL